MEDEISQAIEAYKIIRQRDQQNINANIINLLDKDMKYLFEI